MTHLPPSWEHISLDAAEDRRAIFKAPYRAWTAAELLDYFQNRTAVRYFPVLDEEQTTREKIDNVLRNRFEFNDELHQLPAVFDWLANPSPDKEWIILWHKFYYAVGLGKLYLETGDGRYAGKWLELTESWIDNVPLDFLSSDVTGRRVQNWVFAHYYFVAQTRPPNLTPDFYLKFLASLRDQVDYLRHHLTPARNHRTIELYAIFLAAVVFPEFQEAGEWLAFSRQALYENLETDFFADGVHYELSTDYHHLVLKNHLGIRKLALLNQISMPAEMDVLLQKALEFAMHIHKPDGLIPSFSDGDARSFLDLLLQGYELYGREDFLFVATQGERGRPPARRSAAFPDGGYHILRSGWGATEPYADERYLAFDCGPLGVGNHGHLDLLNFEMAAYGRSLIVDPARYTYNETGETRGAWRALFRGTSYHNTVQVDKKNQTRYVFQKTRFKVRGPAPDYELRAFISEDGFDYLHGVARSHEYEAVHERRICFVRGEYWIISDQLWAEDEHDYDLLFHLSDEAWGQVETATARQTRLVHAPHLVLAQPLDLGAQLFVEDGWVSRTYGVKHPAPILRFARRAANAAYHTVLYPYKVERPQIEMATLPARRNGKPCSPSEAFALSVTVEKGGERITDYYFNADPALKGEYSFAGFTCEDSLLLLRQNEAGQIFSLRETAGAFKTDNSCHAEQAR
jgi:hypothetical protein